MTTLKPYQNIVFTAADGQQTYHVHPAEIDRVITVEKFLATHENSKALTYTLKGHGMVVAVAKARTGYAVLCHNHEKYRYELVSVKGFTVLSRYHSESTYRFALVYSMTLTGNNLSLRAVMTDTETSQDMGKLWVRLVNDETLHKVFPVRLVNPDHTQGDALGWFAQQATKHAKMLKTLVRVEYDHRSPVIYL